MGDVDSRILEAVDVARIEAQEVDDPDNWIEQEAAGEDETGTSIDV